MSIAIEMEPALSLDRLPPDIVRRIVHVGADEATDMRFISRSWNDIAKSYLTENPKLPVALERVYLSRGIPEDMYEDRRCRETRKQERNHLHMYSIFPKQHSKRIGVGGWLKKHVEYRSGAIEVTPCVTKRIPKWTSGEYSIWRPFYAAVFVIMAIVFIAFVIESIRNVGIHRIFWIVESVIIFIDICAMLLVCFVIGRWESKDRRESKRLARFFSSFTHIDTLVLDNFRISANDLKSRVAIDALPKMLKCVRINRLEVRENYLSKYLRKQVLGMCRVHHIRKIFLTAQDFNYEGFRDFVVELVNLDVTFDLYERNGMNDRYYFHQTRQWWTETENFLRVNQISMRMTTVHEASFNKAEHQFGVKSHIRFEKLNGNVAQPLRAVAKYRGFNHRWN